VKKGELWEPPHLAAILIRGGGGNQGKKKNHFYWGTSEKGKKKKRSCQRKIPDQRAILKLRGGPASYKKKRHLNFRFFISRYTERKVERNSMGKPLACTSPHVSGKGIKEFSQNNATKDSCTCCR